jgi:hypothetical protein
VYLQRAGPWPESQAHTHIDLCSVVNYGMLNMAHLNCVSLWLCGKFTADDVPLNVFQIELLCSCLPIGCFTFSVDFQTNQS